MSIGHWLRDDIISGWSRGVSRRPFHRQLRRLSGLLGDRPGPDTPFGLLVAAAEDQAQSCPVSWEDLEPTLLRHRGYKQLQNCSQDVLLAEWQCAIFGKEKVFVLLPPYLPGRALLQVFAILSTSSLASGPDDLKKAPEFGLLTTTPILESLKKSPAVNRKILACQNARRVFLLGELPPVSLATMIRGSLR